MQSLDLFWLLTEMWLVRLFFTGYRITPYREMKKSNQMAVRRSNSLRHNMRYKDENENMSRKFHFFDGINLLTSF